MKTAIHRHHHAGFTLVEIMIVVAIIALLAAIAVPGFQRARKRSQASRTLTELRLIEFGIDQYAIEYGKKPGDPVSFDDVRLYLKQESSLYSTGSDVLGNTYGSSFTVDIYPKVNDTTFNALSDVAPPEFWSPYH
jgi:prepilin-type N-terminal cleavage/methylation domain-containing protein